MDYANGTDFDNPENYKKDLNPMEFTKDYVTSAGRGTNKSSEHSNTIQNNSHNSAPKLGVVCRSLGKTREITAEEQHKRQQSLQEQIQQAMGGSYSNYSIERNFQQAPKIQFEDAEPERSVSTCSELVRMDSRSDTDSLIYETASRTSRYETGSKPFTSTQDAGSPKKRGNQSRGKKSTFRKLVITEQDAEHKMPNSTGIRPSRKTISDLFKQPQTFDGSKFLNESRNDPFQLKAKNDFPVLK